jgi:hypothetical protein
MNQIYQLCYNQHQVEQCIFPTIVNRECSEFFENEVIAQCVKDGVHRQSDWFGVLSWRIKEKIGLRAMPNLIPSRISCRLRRLDNQPKNVRSLTHSVLLSHSRQRLKEALSTRIESIPNGIDAVSIITFDAMDLVQQGESFHNGFARHFREMCTEIGITSIERKYANPILFNYWLMRPEIVEEYVATALVPAMNYLSHVPALYQGTQYGAGLPEHLRGKWGSDSFPMHPFLLERLPSVWLHHRHVTTGTLGF